MRKAAFVLTFIAASALLMHSASAIITPGDTFTFDIAGFNTTSGVGYILGSDETATFGMTQTFTAAGYNGQDYTISSSEAIGATTTVDTITVSTPTNFLTTTTVSGTKITALQLDVGDANSGVTSGTADPLNYLTDITGATATGYILYTTANTQFALNPALTDITTTSISGVEGVNDGTTAISTLAIHQFTLTITYPTLDLAVPEPSTWALCGFGLIGCIVVVRRRLVA